ncbi:MAG: inorganic phosphate transporter [Planctomycetota bacterium]
MLTMLVLVVVAALIFDFINGFHDAANAIATSVATGVMSIRTAVIVSGIFNFIGALSGTAVASFIASGLVPDISLVTPTVILSTLIGASAWNLITWWYGIPSSSSHALIGALAGAVVAHAGFAAFSWEKMTDKVLIPLVQSPAIGFFIAFLAVVAAVWIFRNARPAPVNRGARVLQFVSACTLSYAHGLNDAQKVMGVITLGLVAFMSGYGLKPLLVPAKGQDAATFQANVAAFHVQSAASKNKSDVDKSVVPSVSMSPLPLRSDVQAYEATIQRSGMSAFMKEHAHELLPTAHIVKDKKDPKKLAEVNNVPFWAIFTCAAAMCLGTIAGGKRIIKTMGSKIVRMSPLQGFAAQTSGTAVIIGFSMVGTPLSTTHCISASILGAGSSFGLSRVRWNVAINIVFAWLLTLPASAAMAWLVEKGLESMNL